MENLPPPLLGFNNNVRHQGRVFHIQTEDSGVRHARIVTHLFADGGRILRTTRTDYSERVGHKDMAASLRLLMKEQHKAMFIALRAGELDDLIAGVFDEQIEQEPTSLSGTLPGFGGHSVRSPSANSAEQALPTTGLQGRRLPVPHAEPMAGHDGRRLPVPHAEPMAGHDGRSLPVPRAATTTDLDARGLSMPHAAPSAELRGRSLPVPRSATGSVDTPEESGHAAPRMREQMGHSSVPPSGGARPAPVFEALEKPELSIFGEGLISEKSLDEVILSYLAEDLEETLPPK